MHLAALAGGVAAAAAGHVLLRGSLVGRSAPTLLLAVAAFLVGQVGYYVALRGLEVGTVYMANGFIPVIALALSRALLGERVTARQAASVGLIVLGVLVYNA